MNEYIAVLKKYAQFSGRSHRREYWMFFLVNLVISVLLNVIDGILGLEMGKSVGVLSAIYGLAMIIPSLSVGARRLHDTGRSGWWLLLSLIPIIGWIVLIVFLVQDSQPGTNTYGPNPKATDQ
ncbi:MAG: DUF805 domain-containing protein [Candidatus Margulisiibacteriota bacterium]